MPLNHPETTPHPTPSLWKNHLLQNRSLVSKRLGTAEIEDKVKKYRCLCKLEKRREPILP